MLNQLKIKYLGTLIKFTNSYIKATWCIIISLSLVKDLANRKVKDNLNLLYNKASYKCWEGL